MLRPAAPADAPAILSLRDSLALWHAARGISQWREGQIPLAVFERQIADGEWHVRDGSDGLAAAVRVLDDDPAFWVDSDTADAGYVHGLMVAREESGAGLGARVLAFAEDLIARRGWSTARLDCMAANAGLRAYYEARGYTLQGVREFPPGDGRYAAALFAKPVAPQDGMARAS
ncbi:GNAT family N-acetyltransferase [Microbacterium gilvum]|uniref:GNAT family N-acetyltransferase n=1 Tax=Microbacterium gilvum TaxID=1336204 RepID=A0ABP8ZZZ2_9MICO